MVPLFIIGNPRSGTSLLRLMLTCHDNIIIPPESHFFLWLENKYFDWQEEDGYEEFLFDLYNSRKFETWQIEKKDLFEYLSSIRVSNFSNLIEEIYLFYGYKTGKSELKIWGDKNKLWKEKLSKIPNYFPNSKFIHIIRDGRDVACSFINLHKKALTGEYAPKLPHKIDDIAQRWNLNVTFIEDFLKAIKDENVLIIRFEDLIRSTEIVLKQICTFLNISFDFKMLNYFQINLIKEYEPKDFMRWKTKLNEKPDLNTIGQFHKLLSLQEIDYFEQVNCRILERYDYK